MKGAKFWIVQPQPGVELVTTKVRLDGGILTEIVRNPGPNVDPQNLQNWLNTYTKHLEDTADAPPTRDQMESSAVYADSVWDSGRRHERRPDGGSALRIAAALGIAVPQVPAEDAKKIENFERDMGRAAHPEEIKELLGGPLLARLSGAAPPKPSQRTLDGRDEPPASMDPPDAPAPKKRGRPPKVQAGATAAPKPANKAAAPVVTGNAKTDREIELLRRAKKALEPMTDAAGIIANALVDVDERYWSDVLDLGRARAKEESELARLRERLVGDIGE